jgi:hypothetical protein
MEFQYHLWSLGKPADVAYEYGLTTTLPNQKFDAIVLEVLLYRLELDLALMPKMRIV